MRMSVRASKIRFTEGERVLCYEPDPTKAKVLYDSKVLDVVTSKDCRGKKSLEYLIHFQGWNSSWDRCVEEEFVLKDTPENRQLQRDLAEQSQLHIGAYLYRKERKKQPRKLDEQRNINTNNIQLQPSENNNCDSPAHTIDTEGYTSVASSSETESGVEDEIVTIELPDYLKQALELDYYLINNRCKLMKLPAELHVVTILENYWKHYCSSLLCEKPTRRVNRTVLKPKPEDFQRNLHLCKEMLDGLRIYFDFTLTDLLLYSQEKGQIDVVYAKSVPPGSTSLNQREGSALHSQDVERTRLRNVALTEALTAHNKNNGIAQRITRRRSLRSHKTSGTNGSIQDEPAVIGDLQQYMSENSSSKSEEIDKILSWQLLPAYVYQQQPPPPSLVYGATHLLRLFVKLPELLNASGIMESKLKVLKEQLKEFLNYLNDHKEWYGDRFYTD